MQSWLFMGFAPAYFSTAPIKRGMAGNGFDTYGWDWNSLDTTYYNSSAFIADVSARLWGPGTG